MADETDSAPVLAIALRHKMHGKDDMPPPDDGGEDDGDLPMGLEDAMNDLMDAIKSGDAKAAAHAFMNADACAGPDDDQPKG